ncbi:MAG: hypothetical protein ACYS15_10170 [Planctomycetota bacterium]
MADTEKRIVVEGVEYAQLVQFPRILRAVTASFQPSRLVLGLLMVAALMTVGRCDAGQGAADGLAGGRVGAGGGPSGSGRAARRVGGLGAGRGAAGG